MIIVDEFTGRKMEGRQWSDGLHQAVEAKEGVTIKAETQTLATITLQNYFKLYKKLGGMTGTAMTEARRVLEDLQARRRHHSHEPAAPPHQLHGRDLPSSEREKWDAVVDEIREVHADGPPDPGRHRVDRKVRVAQRQDRPASASSTRSERQVSRTRGRNYRPGRPRIGRHHRHQHGGPRHRHHPGGQSRIHGVGPAPPPICDRASMSPKSFGTT